MVEKTFTAITRLRRDEELWEYLDNMAGEYGKAYRYMWRKMTAPDYNDKFPKESKFVTHICEKFGFLKRTVNSLLFEVKGRIKALRELKESELDDLSARIKAAEKAVRDIEKRLDKAKPAVTANRADEKALEKYRNDKASLYWKKNRLNKLRQKQGRLEDDISKGVLKLGFGGRDLFKAQHNLKEDGFRSHEGWLNAYRRARDANITIVGSSDEKFGSQIAHLQPAAGGGLALRIRREHCSFRGKERDRNYITVNGISFGHLQGDLMRILSAHMASNANVKDPDKAPVSIRFHRKGTRWYLQAMFPIRVQEYGTTYAGGVIGMDFNSGHIDLAETDASGNLVGKASVQLKHHGSRSAAESEMRLLMRCVTSYAAMKGKDIAIEDLKNFKKKKAASIKSNTKRGKALNRMRHSLDYSRFAFLAENSCHRQGVGLHTVNPRNTSKIGAQKYAAPRKLVGHVAAAYVIARRAQGFEDALKKKAAPAPQRPKGKGSTKAA